MEYIKLEPAEDSYYYEVEHHSGVRWWIETRKVMHNNIALTFNETSKKDYDRATRMLLQTDKTKRLW